MTYWHYLASFPNHIKNLSMSPSDLSFGQGTSSFPTLGTPAPPQPERLAAHHGLVFLPFRVVLSLCQGLFHLTFGAVRRGKQKRNRISLQRRGYHTGYVCDGDSPHDNDGYGAVGDAIPADASHSRCTECRSEFL